MARRVGSPEVALRIQFCLQKLKNLIRQIKQIREWEETHLPTYGSHAGRSLFLELASSNGRKTLKEIYLSMSCAESTTRLLLRNLESDGWIHLLRDAQDQRLKELQPTEKFNALVIEWLRFVVPRLNEALDHLQTPGLQAPSGSTAGGAGPRRQHPR
ncbi:MAG: hypothetical protein RIS88_2587 [Pseudomonadota bacterium]|jgi:DNA-binding MarR family transcriptional regulator